MYPGQNDPSPAPPPSVLPAPHPAFQLARHIIIDFEAYEYEVHGNRVPMTLREWQLLFPLVEKYRTSPRGYLSVRYLIGWMLPNWTDYLDPEQSIAQLASIIRGKWGEPPRNPRFLICKRDIGYQLRPEPGYGYVVPRQASEPEPE
jgi:DNA-binding response OmpR family regulator